MNEVKPWARLRDKATASIVCTARRIDMEDGRSAALGYLAANDMGGYESNNYRSAHRILDYLTFKYVNCVPKEHPLWREQRRLEDLALNRRAEAREHRPLLMERNKGKCELCGKAVSGRDSTVDHIDPDGGNEPGNLALLCRSCNSRKSNGSLDRLQKIEEAHRRREEEERFLNCPCHHYGCLPDCTGCEMCEHDENTIPPRLICDIGRDCLTPSQCWNTHACQMMDSSCW